MGWDCAGLSCADLNVCAVGDGNDVVANADP